MYKLRDWVDEQYLSNSLSSNERAIEYLESHEHLIDDDTIFENENAIHIIEKRIQYDKNGWVNCNANAVNFLRNNPQYIDYEILCGEEHGIEFVDELIKNNELYEIDWSTLSRNPAAMHILNDPKYYEHIDWYKILYNKNAHDIIKNNLHMVDDYWDEICSQAHLIDIIEQNMDNINWITLSENHNAIHILEQNLDKLSICRVCYNKNGFTLLLQLDHDFDEVGYDYSDPGLLIGDPYNENVVFEYFDYCEKNNIEFKLIDQLTQYGYTEKHMEFLKHNNSWMYLSSNPNIFEYDYKRMKETRRALLWYNDIKKMKFI